MKQPTVLELVSWLFNQEALVQHIQGGAARGLYPQNVADIVEHITEQHNLRVIAQLEIDNG